MGTSSAAKSNVGLDLAGKFACVSGGTHGIGAAIAVRLAKGGASVIIVGRSEEGGNSVLKQLKEAGGNDHHFIRTDLSLVSGIKDTAKQIVQKAPNGIDYLFETAGKPPVDPFALTDEGHEKHFALQILSRFGLPFLLLKQGKLRESLTIVCAAGLGMGEVDVDDLELRKDNNRNFTLFKRASRDSIVTDAYALEFARRYPFLQVSHMFPGIVSTEQRDLPFGLHRVYNLVSPLLALTIGHNAQQTAEGAVYLGCNPASKLADPKAPRMFSPWLGQWRPSSYARSEDNCRRIYDKLAQTFS